MRKVNLIIIFLFTAMFCEAQEPITWQRIFFNIQSIAYKSHQTHDGGYITTGYTYVGFEGSIFLIKQNAYGDTLWTKLIVGATALWVEQTFDKGFIVGGRTTLQNTTALLVKTDSLGNIMWQRTYVNIYGSQLRCVKQTSDSGYILALSWELSNGGVKIMLMKTDSIGNTEWQKIYYGPDRETPNEVIIVGNTGYIVVGNTSNGFIPGTDIFIIRVNLSGDTLWTRIIGSPNYGDVGYKIQNTTDGGFILCGWSASFTSGLRHESYVVKMDSLGNLQWQRLYSSLGGDESYAIRIINNGYVIAGYSDTLNNGDGRAKIRILDNFGNVVRQTSFKPTEQEAYFNSVEKTYDGGFILCGETHNTSGSGRVYIAKTDSLGYAVPIGIINNNNELPAYFKLYQNYPNPFNSQTVISFDLKEAAKVRLTVFDILGRKITLLLDKFMPVGKRQIIFDADKFGLASGIYFYNLSINTDVLHFETVSLNKKMVYLK